MSHESDSALRHRNMSKVAARRHPHVGASMPAIGFVRHPRGAFDMRASHAASRQRGTGRPCAELIGSGYRLSLRYERSVTPNESDARGARRPLVMRGLRVLRPDTDPRRVRTF